VVLNDSEVKRQVLRSIAPANIIGRLATLNKNALIIGERHVWLINCVTAHKSYCVGTQRQIAISRRATSKQRMEKLKELVSRYASNGALIQVWELTDENTQLSFIGRIRKPKTYSY